MGLNHSTYCLRANSDKVKFVNGGLESYDGLTAKDLSFAKMSFARPFEGHIEEFSFARNKPVYSWLVGDICEVAGHKGARANGRNTKAFIEWVNSFDKTKDEIIDIGDPKNIIATPEHNFEERYGFEGTEEYAFFPLQYLLDFDYDAVALVVDKERWIKGYPFTLSTKHHPEGLTYRQLFKGPFGKDNDYFDFLKKAEEFKWDAVMFVIE